MMSPGNRDAGMPANPHRYIAVDGPPGAGASALARALAKRLGAALVVDPARQNPLLPELAERPQRTAFQTQIYCLLARWQQQRELEQPELFGPRSVVCDYFFARDALFAAAVLGRDELDLYDKIASSVGEPRLVPDLAVFVTADLSVLRSRVKRLVGSVDRVIKLSVLDELAASMNDWVFSYRQGPLLVINTSEFDFEGEPGKIEELTDVIINANAGTQHVRPLGL